MKKLVVVLIVLLVAWHMARAHHMRSAPAVVTPGMPPGVWHAPRPHGPHGPGWHNRRTGRSVVIVHESSNPAESIAPAPPRAPVPPAPPAAPALGLTPSETASLPEAAPDEELAPKSVADKAPAEPSSAAKGDEVEGTPSWFAAVENWESTTGPSAEALRTVKSRQLATPERARADVRVRLNRSVSNWLAPDVPRTWKAPQQAVDALVLDRHIERVDHDYGPLYVAGYRVDVSPERRARLLAAYHHEIVGQRLFLMGSGLAFVLVCLGALAGYIRADEATKGYYTNRLRLVAAAGVGAAGFALYQALV